MYGKSKVCALENTKKEARNYATASKKAEGETLDRLVAEVG